MGIRGRLTNEAIKGFFGSNFELANYAIRIARHDIRAGREVIADDLLDDLARNPSRDLLKEIEEADAADSAET